MDQPIVKEHHKDIQAQVDAYIETQSQAGTFALYHLRIGG